MADSGVRRSRLAETIVDPRIIPDDQVRAEVATWPPLTSDQLNALAALMRPHVTKWRQDEIATRKVARSRRRKGFGEDGARAK
jgi:hypothetical protein